MFDSGIVCHLHVEELFCFLTVKVNWYRAQILEYVVLGKTQERTCCLKAVSCCEY